MADTATSREPVIDAPPNWAPLASAEPTLRANLRVVTTAWLFGAAWMYITTGAVMTRYAKDLGVSEFGFGLLAALPHFGALMQLPASYFMERFGHRKRLFIAAGLAHRFMWVLVAAIPWVAPQATWWWLLLLVLLSSHLLANAMTPAWVTWMADLVPGRIRGRYFSTRGQYGRLVGVVTTVLIGLAMDWAERTDGSGLALRQFISIALAGAALSGMLDIAMFRRVPEASHPRTHVEPIRFWRFLGEPLRDRNFRLYLGFSFTLTFAIAYVGQFIWLYLFDVVGMTNMQANVMLVALPLVVSMMSFPMWGRLVDRLGCKPVLLIAGLLIVHGGASWVLVTRESWWIGYLGSTLATAAWPGVELAMFNLMLGISADRHKARRGSAYVAVHSTVVATAGVLSGVFGGALAHIFAGWEGEIFGWPLTYHGILLIISAVLRFAALLWLIGLHEPTAVPTRSAIRYVVAHIYGNVQQAIFTPTRGLGRLGRLTYRFARNRNAAER